MVAAAQSAKAWRVLARLGDRRVNYSEPERAETAGQGWRVTEDRQPLPAEPPGPPVAGGSWEVARRLVRDYAFADPRIVRAYFDPDAPLEGRDMLLVGRFFGLRFRLGVRVGEVIDGQTDVDGRPARVWGWGYRTLEGHLEAGRMDYEVWKWTDTGAVEFRMRRLERAGAARQGVVGLGWRVFGRWMQGRFDRRARERMRSFVRRELGIVGGADPGRPRFAQPWGRRTAERTGEAMVIATLRSLGVRSQLMYAASLASIVLCLSLWVRAKTIDQAERGNAERRAIFVGLWPPMFWLIGDRLEQQE